MASFPVVLATNNGFETSASNHVIAMPSGIEAGDRLVVFFATVDDAVPNTPSGWTKLVEDTNASFKLVVYYKVAAGSDTLTINTGASTKSSAHTSYRIYSDNDAFAAAADGTGTTPNPPNLNPAQGVQDFLWMAAFTGDEVSAYPTNYSSSQVSNISGGVKIASAVYANNAASEDPGTFTTGVSSNWIAVTVGIEAQTPLVGNFPILTRSSTVFSPAIDFAGDGNFPILEMNSQIFTPTATVSTRTRWTNEPLPTTTWTNEPL